jgi:alpha-glucosidase
MAFLCGFGLGASTWALDYNGFQGVGALTDMAHTDRAVTLSCADGSHVQISVLTPDMVRVRTAFHAALPERDHSWAIAKTDWAPVPWTVTESAEWITLATSALEVVIRRDPLLIEFRDPKTHAVINSDLRPMATDPRDGSIAAFKRLGLDERFYGLGEKATRLEKRRGAFTMWTSDTPAYRPEADPIYQSIPFYVGRQNGAFYGLFFDNSYRSTFDFGKTLQDGVAFSSEGGEMNYYFIAGPALPNVLGRYADLTGHMPMPPKWALGHQQSRYSYFPDSLAEDIVKRYRAHDLPLDVLHLDIHYMDGYRVFTWNPERFPHPAEFIGRLAQQGVKVVAIVDPGVKMQPPVAGSVDTLERPEVAPHEKSYYVYNQGAAAGYFLKRASGEVYQGRVWPGQSVFVDYTIDAAAKWWGDLHRAYLDNGVAGIWTDMNEPSDFTDKSGKTQGDVVWDDLGAHSSYAQNRNLFALGMTRATYEGLARLRPDRRPFVITRSGFAGIQRYSTMWTGDNNSTWEALALTLPMFQSLGLSGQPFIGSDIPGFMGRADGELMVRWYQAGFLVPFCRNHANNNAYDHEPWRFGPYYEDIVRKYLKLRYRLMPFLYTTLEEAHRTGVPLFRPLLLNFPDDENTVDLDDEYMIGTDLLAAPIVTQGATSRRVYFPPGTWYDLWTGARQNGGTMRQIEAPLEATPVYVRGGGVLPMGVEMNYVSEKPEAPVTLHVYPDANGSAAGSLYEDDDLSPDYQKGVSRRTVVTYRESAGAATVTLEAIGKFQPVRRELEVAVHSPIARREVSLDGHVLPAGAAGKSDSWSRDGDVVTIRFHDGAAHHQLTLK